DTPGFNFKSTVRGTPPKSNRSGLPTPLRNPGQNPEVLHRRSQIPSPNRPNPQNPLRPGQLHSQPSRPKRVQAQTSTTRPKDNLQSLRIRPTIPNSTTIQTLNVT